MSSPSGPKIASRAVTSYLSAASSSASTAACGESNVLTVPPLVAAAVGCTTTEKEIATMYAHMVATFHIALFTRHDSLSSGLIFVLRVVSIIAVPSLYRRRPPPPPPRPPPPPPPPRPPPPPPRLPPP